LVVLALTTAISVVAVVSGNNLLYMVVSVLWALGFLSLAIGQWNVRGLTAVRVLPVEFFAGLDANGRIQIRNHRRWMPGFGLEVCDLDTTAQGFCDAVGAGQVASTRVRWRFERRGKTCLRRVRLASTFPFGLTLHHVDIEVRGEVVVYPRPGAAAVRHSAGEDEGAVDGLRGRGLDGDFFGLRSYRPGDRPKSIHWRTSARVGDVVVVERAGDAEPFVEVVLRRGTDASWEREISRATGELIRAFMSGCRVGMLVDDGGASDQRFRPNSGGTWRRILLEVLALQPEADT